MSSVHAQDVDLVERSPDQVELPKRPLNEPALLTFHPTSWRARIGKTPELDRVVPSLIIRSMQPGTNSIGESMRGDTARKIRAIRSRSEDDRSVLLPPNSGPVTPWNPEGKGYIVRIRAREDAQTGAHHMFRWDRAFAGTEYTKCDDAKFDAYISYWQAEGLIPKTPRYDVIQAMIGDLSARLARLTEQEAGKPQTVRRANMARELAAWRAIDVDPETLVESAQSDSDLGDADVFEEIEPAAPIKLGRKSKTAPAFVRDGEPE